ncbi:MAG: hypothetical protein GY921_11295, partial [Phycisphaeraceae bacterium]|nr:hypothetical protein [Phycisphaeraceae bacterium]
MRKPWTRLAGPMLPIIVLMLGVVLAATTTTTVAATPPMPTPPAETETTTPPPIPDAQASPQAVLEFLIDADSSVGAPA